MGEFSLIHWVVVLAVAAIFLGPSRLPQLGSGLGEMISNFRKAFRDAESSIKGEDVKLGSTPSPDQTTGNPPTRSTPQITSGESSTVEIATTEHSKVTKDSAV